MKTKTLIIGLLVGILLITASQAQAVQSFWKYVSSVLQPVVASWNVELGDTLYVDGTNLRVGIKDTTPSYELDVNGQLRVVGTSTLGITTINGTSTNPFSVTLDQAYDAESGTRTIYIDDGNIEWQLDTGLAVRQFEITAGGTTMLVVRGGLSPSMSFQNYPIQATDGAYYTAYDSDSSDHIRIEHDGSYGVISTVGTNDTDLRLSPDGSNVEIASGKHLKLFNNLTDGTNSLTVANAKTAYDYSQIGHLPLSGGTVTGTLTVQGTSTLATTSITGLLDIDGTLKGGKTGGLWGINVETLTGDKTLTPGTDEIYQYLDEGGASRDITLATTTASAGDRWVIRHNGSYADAHRLYIKQGATTLDEIWAGAIKEFIFDGTNWISAVTGTGEDDTKTRNVTIGYRAQAYDRGVSVGYTASSYNDGVSIGTGSAGYSRGVGVGYAADGYDQSVALGYTTQAVDDAVAIGYQSRSEDQSVALGYQAGNRTGDYKVSIGYQAGANETNNYRLYIDSSNTASPLIYGEFDNDIVKINGDLVLPTGGAGATAADTIRLKALDLSAGDAGLHIMTENDTEHLFASKVGLGTSSPTGILSVATSTGEIIFEITDAGDVGIGTTTPVSKLQVVGKITSIGIDAGMAHLHISATNTQAIAVADTPQDVVWWAVSDEHGDWGVADETATTTLTVPNNGTYYMTYCFQPELASGANKTFEYALFKNGSQEEYSGGQRLISSIVDIGSTCRAYHNEYAAGDQLKMQISGTNANVQISATSSAFNTMPTAAWSVIQIDGD